MIATKLGLSLRDLLWVTQPETVRVKAPAEKRLQVRALLERGRTALAAASRIDDGRARALLGATALRSLLEAVAVAAGLSSADHERDLEAARGRVHAGLTDSRLKAVLEAYTDRDQDPPRDDRSLAALRDLASFIELLVDNRSPREIRLGRSLWPAAIVVAALCALWLVLKPKNLAAGKLVTASSSCHAQPPAPYGKAPLARMVDGFTREFPFFGGCTGIQQNPWVLVDLAEPRVISKMVVYGRSDCCWGAKELPLEIQFSEDNREFVTVATRTLPFSDEFPWRVRIDGKTARYVRLYNPSAEPREILVNEVEIYGR